MTANSTDSTRYVCVGVSYDLARRWYTDPTLSEEIGKLIGNQHDWFFDRGAKFWFRYKDQATLFKLKYGN